MPNFEQPPSVLLLVHISIATTLSALTIVTRRIDGSQTPVADMGDDKWLIHVAEYCIVLIINVCGCFSTKQIAYKLCMVRDELSHYGEGYSECLADADV